MGSYFWNERGDLALSRARLQGQRRKVPTIREGRHVPEAAGNSGHVWILAFLLKVKLLLYFGNAFLLFSLRYIY